MASIDVEAILQCCEAFRSNVDDIATFYLSARTSAEIMSSVEDLDDAKLELHVSDDFPLSWTTIRTPEDVRRLYEQGEYERLNSYQSLVSVCSVFEHFVSEIRELTEAPHKKKIFINSFRRSEETEVQTKAICSVRSIHEKIKMDSPLNWDKSLCWIYNFFLLRNIVVHNHGVLSEKSRARLVGRWKHAPTCDKIRINSNNLDDLYNFTKDHVKAFEMHIRNTYGESSS